MSWDGLNCALEAPSFALKWISKDHLRYGDVLCRCLKIGEMNLVKIHKTCCLLNITSELRWIMSFKTYALKWSETLFKEGDVSSCSKWKQNRASLLDDTHLGCDFTSWSDMLAGSKFVIVLFPPHLLNLPGGLSSGSVVPFLWSLFEDSSHFVQDHLCCRWLGTFLPVSLLITLQCQLLLLAAFTLTPDRAIQFSHDCEAAVLISVTNKRWWSALRKWKIPCSYFMARSAKPSFFWCHPAHSGPWCSTWCWVSIWPRSPLFHSGVRPFLLGRGLLLILHCCERKAGWGLLTA